MRGERALTSRLCFDTPVLLLMCFSIQEFCSETKQLLSRIETRFLTATIWTHPLDSIECDIIRGNSCKTYFHIYENTQK